MRHKPRVFFLSIFTNRILGSFQKNCSNKFLGAVSDTGAQKNVMGIQQADAYCKFAKRPFHLFSINWIFIFGDHSRRSIGSQKLILPTPSGPKIIIADNVSLTIPLFFGHDTLDYHAWNIQTVENKLHSVQENWKMLLSRSRGPVFLQWATTYRSLFSRSELSRMHRHFMHPSASKLFSLLHRSFTEKLQPNTLQILNGISRACLTCQHYFRNPPNLTVRFPDVEIFRYRIVMDLMHIDGHSVPHIVDTGIKFHLQKFV